MNCPGCRDDVILEGGALGLAAAWTAPLAGTPLLVVR